MAFAWTDERFETLKQMWKDGHSGSVIGARLGVSRCAVLGKVHRAGMVGRTTINRMAARANPPRRKPYQQLATSTQRAYASAAEGAAREEARQLPDLVIPPAERRKFIDLEPGDCRWPFGDPKEADFHYCNGQQVRPDHWPQGREHRGIQPYCEFHCKRAYNPPAYTGTNIHRVGNACVDSHYRPALSTKALTEFDEMAGA